MNELHSSRKDYVCFSVQIILKMGERRKNPCSLIAVCLSRWDYTYGWNNWDSVYKMHYAFCPPCNSKILLYTTEAYSYKRQPKITANNFLYVSLKKKTKKTTLFFKKESKAWYAVTVFQHSHSRNIKVLLQNTIYELASLMFIFWSFTF